MTASAANLRLPDVKLQVETVPVTLIESNTDIQDI